MTVFDVDVFHRFMRLADDAPAGAPGAGGSGSAGRWRPRGFGLAGRRRLRGFGRRHLRGFGRRTPASAQ